MTSAYRNAGTIGNQGAGGGNLHLGARPFKKNDLNVENFSDSSS